MTSTTEIDCRILEKLKGKIVKNKTKIKIATVGYYQTSFIKISRSFINK
jgi:hypothetical protein